MRFWPMRMLARKSSASYSNRMRSPASRSPRVFQAALSLVSAGGRLSFENLHARLEEADQNLLAEAVLEGEPEVTQARWRRRWKAFGAVRSAASATRSKLAFGKRSVAAIGKRHCAWRRSWREAIGRRAAAVDRLRVRRRGGVGTAVFGGQAKACPPKDVRAVGYNVLDSLETPGVRGSVALGR